MNRKDILAIQSAIQTHSVVLIQGAFGIGKRALIENAFPTYRIVSMKEHKNRKLLSIDPHRFFSFHQDHVCFDGVEFVPDFIDLLTKYSMFVYQAGSYILISSLHQKITHPSVHVHRFFLPDFQELKWNKQLPFQLEEACLIDSNSKGMTVNKKIDSIVKQLFPLLYHVHHPDQVLKLIKLLAENTNKLLNYNELAFKLNISQPTVHKWVQAFEKLELIFLLEPYQESFGKRTIKSSKVYFYDTALMCSLRKIKTIEQLMLHDDYEHVCCNLLIAQLYVNNSKQSNKPMYYWKESNGHEVKCMIQHPTSVDIYEISLRSEVQIEHFKELEYFDQISDGRVLGKTLIYGGYKNYRMNDVEIRSWQSI